MTTFSYAAGSAREVATGLLVVPVFEGPEPGPGVRETRSARRLHRRAAHGEEGRAPARHETPGRSLRGRRRAARRRRAQRRVRRQRDAPGPGTGGGHRAPVRGRRHDLRAGGRRPAGDRGRPGLRRGHGPGRVPLRPLPVRPRRHGDHQGHGGGVGAMGREGDEGRGEAGRHDRRGRVLGAGPRQHARRRPPSGRPGRGRQGDGQAGGGHLQGVDRDAAEGRGFQRHPRRRQGLGEPPAHDRAHVPGRRPAQARRARRARGSRSTPAVSRSSRATRWRR